MKPMIQGVLFDLDGTLTLPGALNFPAIKREMDCPQDQPILEYLESLPADHRARLSKILDLREEQAAENSIPNLGAEKCLSALKRMGLPFGILTRNSLKSVYVVFEKFPGVNIKDFSAIITRENSPPKPDPGGLFKAAGMMGISTSNMMMVGDFRFDIIAGNRAGAFTVLLTNNDDVAMTPGDPEPDLIITSLGDLAKHI